MFWLTLILVLQSLPPSCCLMHVPDGEGFKVFFKILFILLADADDPAILGELVPHKLGLDLSDLFL